jgi:hypothetical protein
MRKAEAFIREKLIEAMGVRARPGYPPEAQYPLTPAVIRLLELAQEPCSANLVEASFSQLRH